MTEKSLNRIKKLLTALVLAGLAAVLVAINLRGAAEPGPEADGLYFQDMRLETFAGGTFTAADLRKNRVTVFVVWNPYCTACIREMPMLAELDAEYAPKGVRIIGIEGDAYQYPEDVEKARAIAAEFGGGSVQLLADAAFTEEVLPLLHNGYPGVFVVDSRGVIREFRAGSMNEAEWRDCLDTALLLTVNTAE